MTMSSPRQGTLRPIALIRTILRYGRETLIILMTSRKRERRQPVRRNCKRRSGHISCTLCPRVSPRFKRVCASKAMALWSAALLEPPALLVD